MRVKRPSLTAGKPPAAGAAGAGIAVAPARQMEAAIAFQREAESVLTEAIDALEHGDAALTYLQQSLGVNSSPRLEQLRRTKAKLRALIKAHNAAAAAVTAEPVPEET